MCQQVQTVTLQTAILQQVSEFAANNTVFSVHDITVAIRQKTAAGELEIPEVEVQGASFRFDIPHAKVKSLFDELYRTGGIFDPNYRLDRAFNGTYFEYTPTLVGNVAATPAPVPTPAPVGANVPVPSAPVAPSVTPAVGGNDITTRVQQYLTNCVARNFRPSLKQVQSAIKRQNVSTGVSCESLKTTIEILGYTVIDNPDALSQAQVATV